jgi:sugar phosphate isomerase/epimerase
MLLGLCPQALYHLPFAEALATARRLGFEAIELPVDAKSPWIDLDAALADGHDAIARAVQEAGLRISALSNHQEGQLILGPHGADTDAIFAGTPAEKIAYALSRLRKTAALAKRLQVDVVVGFTGCEDYSRWFPWPDATGYERMARDFVARMSPLLDDFGRLGVRFAHECHPKQFAFNLETAEWAVELLGGHQAFGFNFDPANLMLAGMDPVVFVAALGDRIHHVHAKDGEIVAHHVARSGLLAHGPWDRRDRGFRFRVPGWGNIDWKRVITELKLAGYTGTISVEHEDPTMGRVEGLERALATLAPLMLRERLEARWW